MQKLCPLPEKVKVSAGGLSGHPLGLHGCELNVINSLASSRFFSSSVWIVSSVEYKSRCLTSKRYV